MDNLRWITVLIENPEVEVLEGVKQFHFLEYNIKEEFSFDYEREEPKHLLIVDIKVSWSWQQAATIVQDVFGGRVDHVLEEEVDAA